MKSTSNPESAGFYTGPSRTYRDLLVWQKAHQFVLEVYRLTRAFPPKEAPGLTLQTRQSAVAIATAIIESVRKKTSAEKGRLMNNALCCADTCEYLLSLAEDLGYVSTKDARKMQSEVSRLISAYASAHSNRQKSE